MLPVQIIDISVFGSVQSETNRGVSRLRNLVTGGKVSASVTVAARMECSSRLSESKHWKNVTGCVEYLEMHIRWLPRFLSSEQRWIRQPGAKLLLAMNSTGGLVR